jgi:hypothetical protein
MGRSTEVRCFDAHWSAPKRKSEFPAGSKSMTSQTPRQLLAAYDDPRSLRRRLRLKRIKPLLDMIASTYREKGSVSVVDIGGTERYWSILPQAFLDEHKVGITIVNLPGASLPEAHGRYRFVCADGCDLSPFRDQSFDIAHSNSVVEHVGDWPRMKAFASETKRVARQYFVQTPNFWFPVEPHCMTPLIHWLPKPARLWLVMRLRLGHWQKAGTVDEGMLVIESARLLTRSMLASLFPEGKLLCERLFLLPKSYTAVDGRVHGSQ